MLRKLGLKSGVLYNSYKSQQKSYGLFSFTPCKTLMDFKKWQNHPTRKIRKRNLLSKCLYAYMPI